MAAPNIVNVATITAKSNVANVTTVTSNVIVNLSNSSTVVKVNHMMLANYTANNTTTNVIMTRAGTNYFVGSIVVPQNSTLVLLGKDTTLYLEEGDYITAAASTNNSVHLISSYEIIA